MDSTQIRRSFRGSGHLVEEIAVVPLCFSARPPVASRSGTLIMVDDDRLRLLPGEVVETRRVRFWTLGCYPLTGAILSNAETVAEIIAEMRETQASERQGRLVDGDEVSAMERKKREGYF
jgi:sulfate adenylyltransferase subunit 2